MIYLPTTASDLAFATSVVNRLNEEIEDKVIILEASTLEESYEIPYEVSPYYLMAAHSCELAKLEAYLHERRETFSAYLYKVKLTVRKAFSRPLIRLYQGICHPQQTRGPDSELTGS